MIFVQKAFKDGFKQLCNDNLFREMSPFGSEGCCLKTYKTLGGAMRKASRIKGRVINIPNDRRINMCMQIVEDVPCPDKPGYESLIRHEIDEFVVPFPETINV